MSRFPEISASNAEGQELLDAFRQVREAEMAVRHNPNVPSTFEERFENPEFMQAARNLGDMAVDLVQDRREIFVSGISDDSSPITVIKHPLSALWNPAKQSREVGNRHQTHGYLYASAACYERTFVLNKAHWLNHSYNYYGRSYQVEPFQPGTTEPAVHVVVK